MGQLVVLGLVGGWQEKVYLCLGLHYQQLAIDPVETAIAPVAPQDFFFQQMTKPLMLRCTICVLS